MGGQVLYELYFTLYLFFYCIGCELWVTVINKKPIKGPCYDYLQYMEVRHIQFKTGSKAQSIWHIAKTILI